VANGRAAGLALVASQPRQDLRVPRLWVDLIVGLVVAAAVTLTGVLALTGYPRLSPIDELQHLDSAVKASQGRWLLPLNERVGEEAMRIEACRGIDAPFLPPPCSAPELRPEDFQESGFNTAAGRPSAYYVVTGYLASWLSNRTGDDFLTSARLVSLLAWALGAGLLAMMSSRVARSAAAGVGIGLVLGVMPPALSQAVTVNPDSWALPVGAVIAAVVLLRGRLRPWLYAAVLSVALVLAVLVKPNFVVLALVPLLIGAHDVVRTRRWTPLASGVAPTLVSLAAFLAASRLFGNRQDSLAPMDQYLRISPTNPWDWDFVRTSLVESMLPVTRPGAVDTLSTPLLIAAGVLAFLFCLGSALTSLSASRGSDEHLGWSATALVLLVANPVIVYSGMWISGFFFGYQQRYSLVALPVLGIAWAMQSPRRPLVPALVGISLFAVVLWVVR
jgi:hypothetical protein